MSHLKQCLGVDLGTNTVKIVELALDKETVRVVRAASAPTGVTGEMSPEEVRAAVVQTAKDLFKKSRFSTRKAVFSISGQKVFIRRFRLPKTSDERLARMIQYEARQQIPFPPEKTYLQFQHRDLPNENETEVLLVAVRTDEIRDHMAMLGKTGLTPVAVGVSSFALYSGHYFVNLAEAEREAYFASVSPRKKAKKKAPKKGAAAAAPEAAPEGEEAPVDEFAYEEVKAFVNLGASAYDLAIGRITHGAQIGGGTIAFSRTVSTGGDDMTRAIMKSCGVESFADAERIKTSACQLMTYNFDFEEEGQVNQEASMAVTEIADRIVTEVRRSVDYFMAQPDGMAIDSLVLSGGQALMPGFDAYLEEKLSVPVTVARENPAESPLRWPDSAGPITPYMISLGLGLQGLGLAQIKVDFLPEDRKIIRDFPYKVTGVMVAIVAVTVMISSQAGTDYAQKFQREADNLQGVIQKNQQQTQFFTETQTLHDEVATEYENLSKIFGQRSYWQDFLAKLAEIKPPEILLTDVQFGHNGSVTIEGISQEQVSAAYFLDSMNAAFKDRLKPVERTQSLLQQPQLQVQPGQPVATPAPPRPEAIIEDVRDINNPPPPFTSPASRFKILLQFKDKQNHLRITPTPSPTPAGAAPGAGFGGQGGRPGTGSNQDPRFAF